MPVIEFDVDDALSGERLDRAVAGQVRAQGIELSNSKAKRLVEDGAVSVEGREAWKASRSVKSGWHVRVEVPDAIAAPSQPERIDLSDRILYADDWVVAVDKPAGVPTHATHDPDRDHVRAAVERWLASQGEDEPYVGVHHRLDVPTSGVLVFARDRRANKGLASAFEERQVTKTYAALVASEEPLPDRWEVEDHLGRDRHDSRRMRSVHSGGDFACTDFRTLQTSDSVSLVEAMPHTGRTHQIRVHLAERDAPILGDELYGGWQHPCGGKAARAMLHAWRLRLPHPGDGTRLEVKAPLPADFLEVGGRCGLVMEGTDAED